MSPSIGHATLDRLHLEPPMSSVLITDWGAWPKTPYIKTPLRRSREEAAEKDETTKQGLSLRWLEGEMMSEPSQSLLQPLQNHQYHHYDEEGVFHLWTMDLWQYLDLSLSYAMLIRYHMSYLTWLWPYYVIPMWWILGFIGWFMRYEPSWWISRCILLPHSLLLVMIKLLCESMCGGWCVLDGVTW
jgi:hypothetical protein